MSNLDAENLYTSGGGRSFYEATCIAAESDPRTALAIVEGCFVEMAIHLVHAEVPSSKQPAALAAFLEMASDALRELAAHYGKRRAVPSAQRDAAALAMLLRDRFETQKLTRTPSEWDRDDTDEIDDEI